MVMATNPPFELEDQTDEDFFDKLVDDDDAGGGTIGGFDNAGAKESEFEDREDSEEVKAFANLSISEGGSKYDNSETKAEFSDGGAPKPACSVQNKDQVDKGVGRPLVLSNSFSFGDETATNEAKITANTSDEVEGWEWAVHGEDQLCAEANCSSLSSNSFSFDNGAVADGEVADSELKTDLTGGEIGGVKEVQWSSFTESASHGANRLGSFSDFFTDFGEGAVGNVYSESKVSGDGTNKLSTSESSQGYMKHQAEHGYSLEQYTNKQDVNSSEYWESLYPGWKYDPNSGQWYQVAGYDATTNGEQCGGAAVGNSQGSFNSNTDNYWAISDETSSQVSYLQQTAQSGVGTVSQTEDVLGWNQTSQGNSGYPAHMLFDPQYPGWYYDTIAQEWRSLEAYHSTAQPKNQAHDQNVQNAFTSTAYAHGLGDFSNNYPSLGPSSEGLKQSTTTSLGVYSQQSANSWQSEALSPSNAIPDSRGNLSWGNASFSNNHVGKQMPSFVSAELPSSYEKSIQGFDNSSWGSGLSSFVPNGSSIQDLNLAQNVEPNRSVQYSTDYYDNQKPTSVSQQFLPNGHQSFAANMERSSAGRPPHALVTFGFGGKLIIMKENTSFGNSLHLSKDANVRAISVVNLMDVIKEKITSSGVGAGNYSYFYALCQQSFPGPLVGGSVGNKELNKWIDESILNSQSPYMDYRKSEVLKLLLSLLKIACQHYGKLRSLGPDTALRETDLPESAVANLFASAKKSGGIPSQFNTSARCLINLPSEAHTQKTAFEVQDLLVSGRKKEALQHAQEGQLWGFALILARELGEQFYVDTVKQMALSQLVVGTPLRTLCLLIAKKPEDVFSVNSIDGVGLPQSMTPQSLQFGGNNMLDNWEENLAVITSNRTDNDHLVITHLGDSLWKERSDITAAHICYLVAEADFEPYSDSARLCLVGGDHWNFPRTYASPEAIQRTELFEYSKVQGNSQFVLVPFQPYKLVYAHMLAEVGKVSDASKYCQVLQKALKTSRSPEVDTLKQQVVLLEERLRTHQQGGYGVNLDPTKIVGKLLNFFDSTAHRVVGGLPPSAPSATHTYEPNNQMTGHKVSSGQPTIAMPSLMPSASMEPISQLQEDSNRMTAHNRSISEPVIGRFPTQDQVDSSNGTASNFEGKTPASAGSSRFSRFNFGAQLLQKTVGLMLKPRQGRQAKLGESNRFYYDDKLKRWVEEGAEPPAEEAAPLPPPTTTAFQSPTLDNSRKSLNEAEIPADSSPESKRSTAPGSGAGLPSIPPTSNQFSARGMTGVRSRYVDTFNKGGGNPANLFQTPSVASVKPPSVGSAKFFIPTAPLSNNRSSDSVPGSMPDFSESKENPSVSMKEPFEKSSVSSATMHRFPSVDSFIPNQGMIENVNDPVSSLSRRTASWSGLANTFHPPEFAKVNSSSKALGRSPLSFETASSSSDNLQFGGGSLTDDLHEVEL